MRTITDLLSTSEGRQFLEDHRITTDLDAFVEKLEAPLNPALRGVLGPGGHKPIFAFQQIYVDITQSMLDRFHLLDDLNRFDGLAPFFLWIDTDRAGSDKITTRIYWSHWGKLQTIPICPGAVKDIETRFVEIDPSRLEAAVEKLEMYLVQSISGKRARGDANQKYEKLKAQFVKKDVRSLSDFNHRVSCFLLDQVAGIDPRSVFVSDLLEDDLLTAEIETALNQLEGIIQAFNQARLDLIKQEIDPVVKPLSERYLPLNYTCPVCQRRLRLSREIAAGDQFAVAACRCGETYRFYLGRRRLALDRLAQTRRWSPDVSLALFMNNLVSGFIGGRSSGIYFGLLMKAALEEVLQVRRVPVLLPEISPEVRPEDLEQVDSLIYRYLTQPHVQTRMAEPVYE